MFLNLKAIQKLESELQKLRPVLQAIAIYDCEVTRGNCVVLEYDTNLMAVALTFGIEAGPVVRWFWRSKPTWELEPEVAPINKYGLALVLSQEAFDSLPPYTTEQHLRPRVYNLNGEMLR